MILSVPPTSTNFQAAYQVERTGADAGQAEQDSQSKNTNPCQLRSETHLFSFVISKVTQ